MEAYRKEKLMRLMWLPEKNIRLEQEDGEFGAQSRLVRICAPTASQRHTYFLIGQILIHRVFLSFWTLPLAFLGENFSGYHSHDLSCLTRRDLSDEVCFRIAASSLWHTSSNFFFQL